VSEVVREFVRPRSVGEAGQLADSGEAVAMLGVPEEWYHGRPEVSSSRLKVMLRSPKAFRAALAAPRVEKAEFDVGHAVHARVLGVGAPVALIPEEVLASNGALSTKAAKEWVEAARAEGKVPLKQREYDLVVRGSDAVLMHPKARQILEPEGFSEVSLFGADPEFGVSLRGRVDRLSGLQLADVKTTPSLAVQKLRSVVDDYGYDLQSEMYRFLFELVFGEVPEPTVLIFMEKEAPYDVRVVRLGEDWIEGGWHKFREALRRFAECSASGVWPGVDEVGEIEELVPAPWYSARVAARAESLEGSL
jgi:hypothetical protein